ncbi:DegT/DnrJ/EryC1/StrS family aminotransferase [Desulfonatronum parangueonense]
MHSIPLIKPHITDAVRQRVLDVLDSGILTEGEATREFEQAVGSFVGAKHCIAVTSCTTGLEMALRCLRIGAGDEVIVPDYTYPATAAVVNIVGATAVIVDVSPETQLIDYDAVEQAINAKTKAVIPVSLFGNPLDWDRLNAIKDKHGVFMIEDAACALGSSYGNRRTGAWADISVFSHHPRKFITTGEGGTITTQVAEWAEWMVSYKHFGMAPAASREGTSFDRVGTNYKLSNVLAAIGLSQMEMVDQLLSERQNLAARYSALLTDVSGVSLPRTTAGGEHSFQTYCALVDNRDRIMSSLRSQGIEAQIGTYALHMHKAFAENPLCRMHGKLHSSRQAYEQALALPLYHGMTVEEQDFVIDELVALSS